MKKAETRPPGPAAAALFAVAWGAPYAEGGPISTALAALRPQLARYGAWQAPRTVPPPAMLGGTETNLYWARELTSDERNMPWIHAFDRRQAYLAVLDGLELGIADPRRYDRPELDLKAPGYWRLRWPAFPPPLESVPDPLARDRRLHPGRDVWVTTPTLELAIERGIDPELVEAWLWPVHRRLLRTFGKRCQDARTRLEAQPDTEARSEAIAALKPVYGAMLGGFLARLKDRKREPPRPPWFRPDWRHAIIAKARANLLRAIGRVSPYAGVVLVINDAIYLASTRSAAQLVELAGLSPRFWKATSYPLADVVERGALRRRLIKEHLRRQSEDRDL